MKILIVDDNANDRRLLRISLEHYGASVIEAADGQEGLRKAREERPELIISDALMPKMDGFQFLRSVKTDEILQSIPFIFYSATYTGAEEARLAVSLGAEEFIIKPKDPQEFWEEILSILENAKLKKEKTIQPEIISEDAEFLKQYSHVVATKLEEKVKSLEKEIAEHKKAEESLRELSGKNQAIIDAIPDLIFRMSRDGVFLEYKPAEGMDTYMTPSEFLGKNIQDIMPQEIAQKTIYFIEKALQTGMMQVFEYQLVMKGGEMSYEARIVSYGKDEVLAIVRDTTERKKAVEQIQILAALVDIAPAAIMVVNLEGSIIYANQTALDLHGYAKEEFLSLYLSDIDVPESAALIEARSKQILETGKASFEVIHYRKDRTTFPLHVFVKLAEWGGKKVFFSIASDITERKKAEETIQKSESFIKNILESVGEGFVVIDSEYRIVTANKAYCEQCKLQPEDIIGRHCYEVSHHIDKPCFMADEECAPKHTFKTGAPHLAIHTHFDKNGTPVYIETRSFPMKDADGKITAVIETLNNITERRTLEEQLRHAQKMEAIGTLAGGIAHDFNNLLNVIIGYGGLMQMKMKPDDPQMEQLKQILAAGDRAAELTRGLLTFSRKQVMETKAVNLNEIVEGFKKMLTRIIGEDIELKIVSSKEDLTIKADIVQIEQVLMNLSANARDAMPKGGTLTIKAEPLKIDRAFIRVHGYGEPGMYALISVSDTGIGMDEMTREKIFEPFFTTKALGRGTGLGLSIVYGIVKQHNGYINCYSELGKGTTFRIYIPLIKAEAEKIEEAEVLTARGGTETILLAEDDANVRKLMADVLEGNGYKVIEAFDGEDAVKKFKENKDNVHLLLFDLIMPRKNGKDAYEDIKGIRHDIRVIFISGYARDIIHKFGIEENIEFISKPISPNELLRKMREVLDR